MPPSPRPSPPLACPLWSVVIHDARDALVVVYYWWAYCNAVRRRRGKMGDVCYGIRRGVATPVATGKRC